MLRAGYIPVRRSVFGGEHGHHRSRQRAGGGGFRALAAEQHEPERRGDHYRQQPGGHQACGASAGDDAELEADLGRGNDERERPA